MPAARHRSRWKAALVALIALSAWLVPLAWSLARARNAFSPSPASPPPPLPADASRPLILFAEGWPTRERLRLDEIQGSTDESASTLAPEIVAGDLGAALAKLGVTAEVHRVDRLPPDLDPARFRPLVLVYPVRHARPAPALAAFYDQRLESLVARQSGPGRLQITDIVLAESAADSATAQASLAAMSRYYGIPFQPGPKLDETSTWLTQQNLVLAQARAIRESLAP